MMRCASVLASLAIRAIPAQATRTQIRVRIASLDHSEERGMSFSCEVMLGNAVARAIIARMVNHIAA